MANAIKDVYPDLDTLKRTLKENRDWRIRHLDRRNAITVIAPHGGFIDEGTSAIARAIAGREHNLFDFQGLRRKDSFDLHVTSTRFSDEKLSKMLEQSSAAISVHGMGNDDEAAIWLGGLNKELKQMVNDRLLAAGFNVNANSPRFRGESPKNVVNLAPLHGVQLELSSKLRWSMFRERRLFNTRGRCTKTTQLFDSFVRAVRAALRDYKAKLSAE